MHFTWQVFNAFVLQKCITSRCHMSAESFLETKNTGRNGANDQKHTQINITLEWVSRDDNK